MPLTPEEQQELAQLERELGQGSPQAPGQTAKTGIQAFDEDRTPPSRVEQGLRTAFEATGLPAVGRVGGNYLQGKPQRAMDIIGAALTPVSLGIGAGVGKLGQTLAGLSAGAAGAGVYQAAMGPEMSGVADKIRSAYPDSGLAKAGAMAMDMAPSMVGGMMGPALLRGLRGGPALRSVPQGQEANALLRVARNNFSLPEGLATKANTTGELRGIMSEGRDALGSQVGAARTAAYDAAGRVPGLPGKVKGAISEGLENAGVKKIGGKFAPGFSKNKAAVKDILSQQKVEGSQAKTLDLAYDLRSRLAEAAEDAKRPNSTGPSGAKYYGAAQKSLDKTIKALLPQEERLTLETANKTFSQFGKLHDMIMKARGSDGKVNPKAFIKQWNEMTPKSKTASFEPHQIKALDQLTSEPGFDAVDALSNAVSWTYQKVLIEPALKGRKGSFLMDAASAPSKFQEPVPLAARAAVSGTPATQAGLQSGAKDTKFDREKAVQKLGNLSKMFKQ